MGTPSETAGVRGPAPADPSFQAIVPVFAKIGLLSFGGPAGQIALMHRELVERHRWLDERRFLDALSFCMLLPGPEAMQLATWCGWRLHGLAGGVLAGLLFVMPGALLIAALAAAYAVWGQTPAVSAVFVGVQAAVLAIVANALVGLSTRALTSSSARVLAGIALLAIFAFAVPFPVIIAVAGGLGALGLVGHAPSSVGSGAGASAPDRARQSGGWRQTATIVIVLLAAWWMPIGALAAWLGPDHVLTQIGLFCSKLAVVTFGGAYAVLAYMAQDVVALHGWLTAPEMMDGLGLAETTPGPLILVTQFVATIAAWRQGTPPGAAMGLAGWAVSLWATFVPCFLWVLAGAPHIEALSQRPRLRAALNAITAAVVGVMANLAIWFGLHLCFAELRPLEAGPASLLWPVWNTVQAVPVILALAGFVALRRGLPVPALIAAGALLAWLAAALG